jgi:hypothetical protein
MSWATRACIVVAPAGDEGKRLVDAGKLNSVGVSLHATNKAIAPATTRKRWIFTMHLKGEAEHRRCE